MVPVHFQISLDFFFNNFEWRDLKEDFTAYIHKFHQLFSPYSGPLSSTVPLFRAMFLCKNHSLKADFLKVSLTFDGYTKFSQSHVNRIGTTLILLGSYFTYRSCKCYNPQFLDIFDFSSNKKISLRPYIGKLGEIS